MTNREDARDQIDADTDFFDLEFLVSDASGWPLGHIYAPKWRRNWAMFQLSGYNERKGPIIVDQRTKDDGWKLDVDWRTMAH